MFSENSIKQSELEELGLKIKKYFEEHGEVNISRFPIAVDENVLSVCLFEDGKPDIVLKKEIHLYSLKLNLHTVVDIEKHHFLVSVTNIIYAISTFICKNKDDKEKMTECIEDLCFINYPISDGVVKNEIVYGNWIIKKHSLHQEYITLYIQKNKN